jgi:hypothetical protein
VLRGDLRSAAARHSAAQIGLEAPEAPAVI